MCTVISICFFVITSVLGITEILRRFWLFLMRPKDIVPSVMIITLKEENAIQHTRYAAEFLNWKIKGEFSSIGVITSELSEETYRVVNKIIKSRDDMFEIKTPIFQNLN